LAINSCSRLAQEEDRRVRGRDLLDLEQDALQCRALADDILEPLGDRGCCAEIVVLRLKPLAQGLHLGQGVAQPALMLVPQQRAREDLADQTKAMDDRLRPLPLAQGGSERNLVFGINDFDETLLGPWESGI